MARIVAEFDEGEAFGADEALAHGEERAGEAAEHRAEREGGELGVGGVDAERAAGDLILAQRLPGAADRQTAQAQRDEVREQRQRQDQIEEKDGAVDRRIGEMEDRGEAVVVVVEGNAEKADVRDAGDAGVTVGQVDPVDQDDADDFAEGERHDGEIVAAQPQHRKAEDDAPHRREHAGERQADPEREAEGRREQRIGIGADGVEGDIAEVEQAGEADHDIQSPAQHDVDHDLDAVIVDPLERAGGPQQAQHDEGKHDDEAQHERADIAPERDARPRRRRDAFAFARRLNQRPAHSTGDDRPEAVEPDAPVGVRHLPEEDEDEDRRRYGEGERPAPGEDELVVDVRFGVIADDRKAEPEGDQPRDDRGAKRGTSCEAAAASSALASGVVCGAAVISHLFDFGTAEDAGGHEDQRDGEDR